MTTPRSGTGSRVGTSGGRGAPRPDWAVPTDAGVPSPHFLPAPSEPPTPRTLCHPSLCLAGRALRVHGPSPACPPIRHRAAGWTGGAAGGCQHPKLGRLLSLSPVKSQLGELGLAGEGGRGRDSPKDQEDRTEDIQAPPRCPVDVGNHSTPKPQDLGTTLGRERSTPGPSQRGPLAAWGSARGPDPLQEDGQPLPARLGLQVRRAGPRWVTARQELRCCRNQTASAPSGKQ